MTGNRSNIQGVGNAGRTGSIDWWSIVVFVLLMILGWVSIYAAVYDDSVAGFHMGSRYGSQLMWMGICIVVATVVMLIDTIFYHIIAYPFYGVMLVLLLATILIGTEVNGARSWIRIGGFTVQPAEFGKLATTLALARYISSYHFSFNRVKDLLIVGAIIVIPMAFIILQKDTGSALVYAALVMVLFREGLNGWLYAAIGMMIFLFVFSFIVTPTVLLAMIVIICALMQGSMNHNWKAVVIYLAGVAFFSTLAYIGINAVTSHEISTYWCLLGTVILSMVPVAIYAYRQRLLNMLIPVAFLIGSIVVVNTVDYVFDNVLQVHQQKRILNLLGVESDLKGWGYNVNQSKIAIGSGGLWGKGFLQGTQTKYDFVPEQSTDFIFCTVGEEWGFAGSMVVLALFCTLIIRLILMGERQKEPFGRVYCYSVAMIFLFHVVVNIGMTIGIMPVIGIPLPLFSYGGSSLLAFTILFFIAVKLDSQKRETSELLRRSGKR